MGRRYPTGQANTNEPDNALHVRLASADIQYGCHCDVTLESFREFL
jgi:hypothetical protein